MTIPFWPPDLPACALPDGQSAGLPDGRLKTQTDTGPGKMRQRSLATRPFSGQLLLTANQRAALTKFWAEDTGGGVLPFWMRDQENNGLPLSTEGGLTLLTETGAPIVISAWWLVTFNAAPVFSVMVRRMVKASLSLSIMP